MLSQLKVMLDLQDQMNSCVHPQWRNQSFAWYRAIWVECAELLDHYGWKWWKHQQPDLEQVYLELVDIWHFGLSQQLLDSASSEAAAQHLAEGFSTRFEGGDFRSLLETFTLNTLQSRHFDVSGFARLTAAVELSFDELFTRYIGKNVLNLFRQDHGYQDGSYRKTWQGKEDNQHLVELISTFDAEAGDFMDQLYAALEQRYQTG